MWRMISVIIMGLAVPTTASAAAVSGGALARCVLAQPEQGGFSGVVAVAAGGNADVRSRGLIGLPGSTPVTASTRFNIGSAGKMFTAVAIGQLIDAGRISLDDPVGRYVEGLAPETSRVTLRQLLTHCSGLGNFFTPDAVPILQRASRLADLMPLISGETPRFTPGSRFDYSNTGFALLGMVVESVTAITYADYVRAHIFAPAGMTATGVDFTAGSTAIGLTTGSMPTRMPPPPDAGGPPPGAPPPDQGRRPGPPIGSEGLRREGSSEPLIAAPEAALRATPAGGMFSTGDDMIRFFQALASGTLLHANTLARFAQTQIDAAPAKGDLPPLYYGFGFGTGSFEGHRWFGHNGGAPGVNGEAIMFPDDDLILIVLANRDPPSATTMFRALRERAFHAAEDGVAC